MFAAWGRIVYRWRWATLLVSSAMLGLSIAMLVSGQGGSLVNGGNPSADKLESVRAADLTKELPSATGVSSSFQLILRSRYLSIDDPEVRSQVDSALSRLQADPQVQGIVTPYDVPPSALAPAMRSKDGHAIEVIVQLKEDQEAARKDYARLRGEVGSGPLQVTATGGVALQNAFDTTTQNDLRRAELFAIPISLVLLLLVFGAVIAALIPIGVGILAVVGGIAATLLMARFTDVSTYAINIVSLIGFGVAIDYSLFLVNRFRDERRAGAGMETAVVRTLATAGRAVTFSGLTVAVGLSGMLFFQGTFLASMGAAGACVVAIAVFYGLTFLPALLSILGDRVDLLQLPLGRRPDRLGLWHSVATWVMRRPVVVLVPALGFLVVAGLPFTQLRMANGSVQVLPPNAQARQGYEALQRDFPGQDQTTITVVVHYPSGSPTS